MSRWSKILVVAGVAAIATGLWAGLATAVEEDHKGHEGHEAPATKPAAKCEMCPGMGEVSAAVDAAEKALEGGDEKAALAEIKKAKEKLAAMTMKCEMGQCPMCKMAKAAPTTTGFVNVRCPIQGGQINPEKVPASLTREYKGQKVAFCCPGCPGVWDKLSDEQKDAKLKASLAK